MKNLLIACIIVLAFASVSFAKLLFVPLKEAVNSSDLIVVGTLKGISETNEEGTIYGKGEIFVERFMAGNVSTSKGVTLKAGDRLQLNYIESFSCVYGSHKRIENEKGIFLLTLNQSAEIQSEDFRSLESLKEIERFLKQGGKSGKVFKTIKTPDETAGRDSQIGLVENSSDRISEISFCAYSVQPKTKYYPFSALLVILASISFYYLLYRSRFKIR
ncbi:MAG TPA: hypothetical protein VF599_00375 [Pyrinomonadaceae bacterium]|jgi:hypothetical protein